MARNIATNRQEITKPRVSVDETSTHSLSFDGNDYVTLSNFPSYAEMSTQVLFKRAGTGSGILRLYESSHSGNDVLGIGVVLHTDNITIGSWLNTGYKVKYGVWYDAILVQDGSNNKLYIDGVLVFSGSNTAITDGTGTLTLAKNSEGLIGKEGIFRRWDVALTTEEISNLYYNKIVPRDNLVAEYFKNINTDGAGTSLVDTSGNGNDGTISGATWTTDTDSKARMTVRGDKSSLLFDGTNDGVLVAQTSGLPIYSPDGSGKRTISFIVKGGEQSDRRIFSEGSSIDSDPIFSIGTGESAGDRQKVRLFIRNDVTTTQLEEVSKAIVFDNNWHSVTFTDNGGDAKLYIDGVLDGADISYTPAGAYSFNRTSVGYLQRSTGASYFNGKVKNTLTWGKVLSPQQIHDLHFKNIIPIDNLVLNLELNEGAGSTVYDTSGNGNNGAITGATWSSDVPSPARNEAI